MKTFIIRASTKEGKEYREELDEFNEADFKRYKNWDLEKDEINSLRNKAIDMVGLHWEINEGEIRV